MKKHRIIAVIIFSVILVLALTSNFIRWEETPLENSISGTPLAIGLLLQVPFLLLIPLFVHGNMTNASFEVLQIIVPFVTSIFYTALYYLTATVITKRTVSNG